MKFGPGGYRLFLASLVVLEHFTRLWLGSGAVYAFFTLSGYWIYEMYERRYSKAASPYLVFIISRFWRILPIFWLANVFTIGIHLTTDPWSSVVADFGPASIVPNVFILGYVHWNDFKYLGQAWSLDVEMQFYLVAPLLIVALDRWNRVAAAVLVLAGIVGLVVSDGDRGTAFTYLLFFTAGMLAGHFDWVPSRKIAWTSALISIVFVAILIALPATRGAFIGGAHPGPIQQAYGTQASLLLALFAMPFSLWTVRIKSDSTDRMFGELSYIVYLMHYAPAYVIDLYFGTLPPAQRLLYVAPTILAIYGGSWLIWKLYDRPIDRARGLLLKPRVNLRGAAITIKGE